jgi:hypothetical protein
MIRSRSRGDLREDSQSSSLTEQQQVLCMGLMLILIHSPRCSFRKPQANLGLLAYHGASVPQHGGVRSRPNPRAELCGLSQWSPEKSFAPSSATLSLSPLVSCLDRTFSVFPMLQNDTAVFHAFAWDPSKAKYDDWRGMGTRAAIAERGFEAQGLVHYCPKEWLTDGWLDKPKGR